MPWPTTFRYVAITSKGEPTSGQCDTVKECAQQILNEIDKWNRKFERMFIASSEGGCLEYTVEEIREMAE